MENYIWRLLTAMFLLMVVAVLGIFGFAFQGSTVMLGISFYGGGLCALLGITKGLWVIIDYNREHKGEE